MATFGFITPTTDLQKRPPNSPADKLPEEVIGRDLEQIGYWVVIPAQAGIQHFQAILGSRLRGSDESERAKEA